METTVEWSWFRTPRGDDPGTTNLCYNAVDRHVVRGAAGDVALPGPDPVDFAGLLEEVAALAGSFRGLGVDATTPVAIVLDDRRDELLALLATARLGAPAVLPDGDVATALDARRPRLLVSDRRVTTGDHVPAAVLLRGTEPEDPARELAWPVALRAGRTDPAGCQAVPPHATAYVLGGEHVPIAEVPEDRSLIGRALAALVAGRSVSPAAG